MHAPCTCCSSSSGAAAAAAQRHHTNLTNSSSSSQSEARRGAARSAEATEERRRGERGRPSVPHPIDVPERMQHIQSQLYTAGHNANEQTNECEINDLRVWESQVRTPWRLRPRGKRSQWAPPMLETALLRLAGEAQCRAHLACTAEWCSTGPCPFQRLGGSNLPLCG